MSHIWITSNEVDGFTPSGKQLNRMLSFKDCLKGRSSAEFIVDDQYGLRGAHGEPGPRAQPLSSHPNRHVEIKYRGRVGALMHDEHTPRRIDECADSVKASIARIFRVFFDGTADFSNRCIEEIAGDSESHGQPWQS